MATLQRFTLEHVSATLDNGQSLPLVLCHCHFDTPVTANTTITIAGPMRQAILIGSMNYERICAIDNYFFRSQFPSVAHNYTHYFGNNHFVWRWSGDDFGYSSYELRYRSLNIDMIVSAIGRVYSVSGKYCVRCFWVLIDDDSNKLLCALGSYNLVSAASSITTTISPSDPAPYGLIAIPEIGVGGIEYPVEGDYGDFTGEVSVIDASLLLDYVTPVPPPTPPDTDPYADVDGEGALPGDSELDLPPEPTTSPIDSGLFSLFSPSTSQMRSLADYLWTDFGGVSDSIPQMLGEIVEALKRSVSNPLNSIFGLSIIASQGLPKGSSSSVHVGFWDTGISMARISKQYFTVDCGSLSFQPVCGNTFLDYAPYSKFSIFLPYVGMRILDANDVVGHTISVKYRGDCVSGALVCFIKRDGQIIAEHSGNCALNLPLSADSWANTISSAARIALSGDVAPAMAGLSMGSASGAVKIAAAVATNPSALAPQVGQSGSVSGSSGHMGSQKPFILRETVRFHSTSHFNSVIGYPAFYFRKLGDCSGYTQVLDVHLHNTPCTGVELKEIEDLLKEGVII